MRSEHSTEDKWMRIYMAQQNNQILHLFFTFLATLRFIFVSFLLTHRISNSGILNNSFLAHACILHSAKQNHCHIDEQLPGTLGDMVQSTTSAKEVFCLLLSLLPYFLVLLGYESNSGKQYQSGSNQNSGNYRNHK